MTRLIIAAGSEFPTALTAVQDWLQPIKHPDYVVHLLHESGLCTQFPADALHLLDTVIADQQWAPQELSQCLNAMTIAAPQLTQDFRCHRLREYSRRRGMSVEVICTP